MKSSKCFITQLAAGFMMVQMGALATQSLATENTDRPGLKAILWNMTSFAQVDSKGVQLRPEEVSRFNIQSGGTSQVFVGKEDKSRGYPGLAQRVDVEYLNSNRDQVVRFTSVDAVVQQTVTLDRGGKVSSITQCSQPIGGGFGACDSVTPQLCAIVQTKLPESVFQKVHECRDTLADFHQAIAQEMGTREFKGSVDANLKALKDSLKAQKISKPEYLTDSKALGSSMAAEFQKLASMTHLCESAVKGKVMELPSVPSRAYSSYPPSNETHRAGSAR